MMSEITGEPARLWGASLIGFGTYNYTYLSGHSGTSFLTGFSPRTGNLVVYLVSGFETLTGLLERLGKHKTSKSCLYLNRLADIDEAILREMVVQSVAIVRARYPD